MPVQRASVIQLEAQRDTKGCAAVVHALCLVMECKKGFSVLGGFVSNAVLFALLTRSDSSIHAPCSLLKTSSYQETFWKAAALNMMLSKKIRFTAFINVTCKREVIKHRKYAVPMSYILC